MPSASSGQLFLRHELTSASPIPTRNTRSLASFMEQFEADEEVQHALTTARRSLAATVYADDAQSFSAIRLRAGLSQKELASRAQTSQSYIARIESGEVRPGPAVIERLAIALDLEPTEVFSAIQIQYQTRGQK